MKKSVWLPALIIIYFVAMMALFAPDWIQSGRWIKFSCIALAEVLVIIALILFLRKREKF